MADPFRKGQRRPPRGLPSNFPTHNRHLNFLENANAQSYNQFSGGFMGYSQVPWQQQHTFCSASSPVLRPQSHSLSHFLSPQNQNKQGKRKEIVARAEQAAAAAHSEFLSSGQSVTVRNIVQSMVLILKVDSLDSLGVRIEDNPYLHDIVLLEGRINAFVQCCVAVRRIATLYELSNEICQCERVEDFENLGLGPLVRHPLIMRYFEPPEHTVTIFKITTEKIVSYLYDFLYKHHDKEIQVDEFLSVVAKKQKVSSPKELCIHIQSLRTHVGIIRRIRKAEKGLAHKIQSNIAMEREIERKEAYELESKIPTQQLNLSNYKMGSKSAPKHVRFETESDSGDNEVLYGKKEIMECPKKRKLDTPSAAEEKARSGKHLPTQKSVVVSSDSNEDRGGGKSLNISERKKKAFQSKISLPTSPHLLTEEDTSQVFKTMMELQVPVDKKGRSIYITRNMRKLYKLFTMEPVFSLLNVAVMSIKMGLWDTFLEFNNEECIVTGYAYSRKAVQVRDVEDKCHFVGDKNGLSSHEVVQQVIKFFEVNSTENAEGRDTEREGRLILLREIWHCERWLVSQFSVQDFACLGFGDFLSFLETNLSEFPQKIRKILTAHEYRDSQLMAYFANNQLLGFLSQAVWDLGHNMTLKKKLVFYCISSFHLSTLRCQTVILLKN